LIGFIFDFFTTLLRYNLSRTRPRGSGLIHLSGSDQFFGSKTLAGTFQKTRDTGNCFA